MSGQLDLFADGRDTALRNDLADALAAGDLGAARAAHEALAAAFPGDTALADGALLIDWRGAGLAAPDPAAALPTPLAAWLRERRMHLAQQVAPAAARLLGAAAAGPWLGAQWRALARAAAPLPWQPAAAAEHAAALYLAAGAWAEAAAAVATIESWRRIPQPLLWMAEARWHPDGADAAWPLLAEALWLAPAAAAALLPRLGEARLLRWTRRFEAEMEPADGEAWAWLPAWLLVDQPLMLPVLEGARAGTEGAAEVGFRAVAALLRLERTGRQAEIADQRRRLRALDAALFAAYMKSR